MSAQVTALQTGTLEWDQPARQAYRAGTPLPMQLRVTNPTEGDRAYRLYLGLYDPQTQQLLPDTLQAIPVDGQESFTIPAQSYVVLQGDVTVDRTGVILALSLYDVAADAVVSQVATVLEGTEAPPGTPGGGLDQIFPLLGGVMALGMMGAVVPMFTGMFKRQRE